MSDFLDRIRSLRKKKGTQEQVGYLARTYGHGQKIISSIECRKQYFYKREYIDKYLETIAQTKSELDDLRTEYRKTRLDKGLEKE